MEYLFYRCGTIDVACPPDYYSGRTPGGMSFGQQYLEVVKQLTGKVGRVYEFCSGPGFIGFSLLSHGLCESLCLSDINPSAIEAVKETIRRNNLESRVKIYQSDVLDDIPEHEKWDLVVGNPPHFNTNSEELRQSNLRLYDPQWSIHTRFYAGVGLHLNDCGTVLIQENRDGSQPDTFFDQIEEGRLECLGSFKMPPHPDAANANIYFIWSMKADVKIQCESLKYPVFPGESV